jgi:hypothetical protein
VALPPTPDVALPPAVYRFVGVAIALSRTLLVLSRPFLQAGQLTLRMVKI